MFPLKKPNRYPENVLQQATVSEAVPEIRPPREEGIRMATAFFSIETVHGMEHICEVYETLTDTWIGAD